MHSKIHDYDNQPELVPNCVPVFWPPKATNVNNKIHVKISTFMSAKAFLQSLHPVVRSFQAIYSQIVP